MSRATSTSVTSWRMLGVGVTIAALLQYTGHYHVEGVGYATITDVLSGSLTSVGLLLLLFALKLAATCLTLGSGGSGGIFSPSLFMGTTLGAAYGIALRRILPGWEIDPAALALAGMAGLVAGATGAALTAIVMIFEMTLGYTVVLPMTLTVAVSYGLRRLLLSCEDRDADARTQPGSYLAPAWLHGFMVTRRTSRSVQGEHAVGHPARPRSKVDPSMDRCRLE